jgi:hypothetical protein
MRAVRFLTGRPRHSENGTDGFDKGRPHCRAVAVAVSAEPTPIRRMSTKIKFLCDCGKSLAVDSMAAGKQARCPSCGRTVQIPQPPASEGSDLDLAPIHDPPPLPTAAKSIWDEEAEYLLQGSAEAACPNCGAPMPASAVVCVGCGYNRPSGAFAGGPVTPLSPLRQRSPISRSRRMPRWLLVSIVILVLGLLFLVACVSQGMAILSAFISGLLLVVGFVMLVIGFFWYWALLSRDNPGAALRMLLPFLTAPFGVVVYWRDGSLFTNRAYRAPKRLIKRSIIFMIAGMLLFLLFIGPYLAQRARRGMQAGFNGPAIDNPQPWPKGRPDVALWPKEPNSPDQPATAKSSGVPPITVDPARPAFPAVAKGTTTEKPRPLPAWSAVPDPRTEPIEEVSDAVGLIPLRDPEPGSVFLGSPTVVLSVGPSPYVAAGDFFGPYAICDLWDLRKITRGKSIHPTQLHLMEPTALSENGKLLAAPVPGGHVEAWSFEQGSRFARLHTPSGARMIAFSGPDRLVSDGRTRALSNLQVWDLKSGAIIREIAVFPEFNLDPAANAASPGGRYFANLYSIGGPTERGLQLYDLNAGKAVASAHLPGRFLDNLGWVHGLAFSDDGTFLAGLLETKRLRVLCWNVTDATVVADYEIAAEGDPTSSRTHSQLEWLPDRSGWLIKQHLLVPFRAGKTVGAKPDGGAAAAPPFGIERTHVLDSNHLLLVTNDSFTVFRLPRDDNGKVALGEGPTTLESLLAKRMPSATVAKPTVIRANEQAKAPPSALPLGGIADRDPDGQGLKHVRERYTSLIAGDGKELDKQMLWFPAAKRPSIGLRWGLGVQQSEKPHPASGSSSERTRGFDNNDLFVHLLSELPQTTIGPIGARLLAELRQRMAEGKFGAWPKTGDSSFHDVCFLGGGKLPELQAAARRHGLDLLLVIDANSPFVGIVAQWDFKITTFDLTTNQILWTSEPLTTAQVTLAEKSGTADPRERFIQKVLETIAADYQLATMPALTAENVKKRLASLAARTFDDPLPVLAELRYYQTKKLADPTDLTPLYDRLLGPGGARTMLEGNESERRAAVQGLATHSSDP